MAYSIEEMMQRMHNSPMDIKFAHLCKVCEHYFGSPRQNSTGHRVYKLPG